MTILKLLRKFSPQMVNNIILMVFVSGIVNAMILAIITTVAMSQEKNNFQYFLLYLGAVMIFLYSKRFGLIKSSILAEKAVSHIRIRIIDKLRRVDLTMIEDMGRAHIHTRLTNDAMEISMGFGEIIHSVQALVMVVFAVVFLAYISFPSFLIAMLVFGICGMLYVANGNKVEGSIGDATKRETELFGLVDHMLDGFQEVRINQAKNDDLFEHYLNPTAVKVADLKIKFFHYLATNLIFSLSFLHILIISVVFVMPTYFPSTNTSIIQTVAIVLYVIGPFNQILSSIPTLSRTTVAIHNLYRFEEELKVPDYNYIAPGNSELARVTEFQKLHLSNFEFHYKDPEGNPTFSIGPWDLEINANEILFIIGGNGSGKSTFLKLLTGLYYPMQGSIKLDTIPITFSNYPDYRNLFSIVFTDFHLFDRLYGLQDTEESVVNQLLRQMEIEEKTRFVDGRFSDINLSTGQKKRLALVAALLEDKSIYVLDEFAADQDPQFRKYFYDTILPDLKKQGKTVIVATHDDHYFYAADRILKMEYGQFIPHK